MEEFKGEAQPARNYPQKGEIWRGEEVEILL